MTSRRALSAADTKGVVSSTGTAAVSALTLAVVACGKTPAGDAAPTSSATTRAALNMPTTPAVQVKSSPPSLTAPEPEKEEPPCVHPKTISPGSLAATWPSRVGQCVRLATWVVRSIDFTRALVQGEKATFIVWMSPDAAWVGVKTNTFVVMGLGKIAAHGRTALPELLLAVD